MAFDLSALTENGDVILAGGGYLLLKSLGVLDMCKAKLNGTANGKSLREHMTSEHDAKESSRTMIQDIHHRSEATSTTAAVQTELLRSMDANIRELLQISRRQ